MKVKTVNNVLSFTIRSSPRGEQNRVTDTVMMLVCICKRAAIKTIPDGLYTPLWCDPVSLSLSLTHTHTHTKRAKLSIWTVNSTFKLITKHAVADSEALSNLNDSLTASTFGRPNKVLLLSPTLLGYNPGLIFLPKCWVEPFESFLGVLFSVIG